MHNLEIYSVNDPRALIKATSAIERGKVICTPSDTVYALTCDALNEQATERIFHIKCRDTIKTLPIFVSGIEMAKDYVLLDRRVIDLANHFWPGPLTIVTTVKPNTSLSRACINIDGTVAIRMPNNTFLLNIIQAIGRPIVATSANLSGQNSCTTPKEVTTQIGTQIDMLIADYEVISENTPSTIVKIQNDVTTILRKGKIDLNEIYKVIR